MSAEPPTVDRVLGYLDGVRGVIAALIFAVIGVAAIEAGGSAGWLVGVASLVLAAVIVVVAFRRRR